MKMDTEKYKHIEDIICDQFNTFGGGRENSQNVISTALKDKPPVFALGVNVGNVVKAVIIEYLQLVVSQPK